MSWPANSRPDLAVIALSARALAFSARRAGLRALAIDLFVDSDTKEHAARAIRAPAAKTGFSRRGLLAVLAEQAPEGLPVVLGAGFEHNPALIAAIHARNPVAGADGATVQRLKNPFALAALLADLDIPHPEIAAHGDRPAGDWLSKRIGASGGAHIRTMGRLRGSRRYLQRRTKGEPVSALFLCDGVRSQIIGFSSQWTDPSQDSPFRYGGAMGPVPTSDMFRENVASAIDRIVARTGLRGLASVDLLRTCEDKFILLEINPRPGATMDVFDHAPLPSLLSLHLDACKGRLPSLLVTPKSAHAAAIVYADRPVSPALLQRPVWTADWPACEETVPAGAPVCTILAAGADPNAARALLDERRADLLEQLRAAAIRPSQTTMVHA